MRKLLLFVLCVTWAGGLLFAQNRTVTGRVTDDSGSPLAGATISLVGGASIATTTTTGNFSITVPNNVREIEVSFVGFETKRFSVVNQTTVAITLNASNSGLEDVVVTGMTRVAKSEYTGAATKIAERDIKNQPVGSFDQIFQGRAPGVLALTSSGQPGQSSNIIIRGTSSISGGSGPLYIVDGIPVEAGVFQSLNPNDFASMDILRDASAAALYGSRGGAGVIVVTTKRGTAGKMRVTYNGQMGVKQRPEFTYDMMTTPELFKAQEDYGRFLNLPYASAAAIPGYFYSRNNPFYSTLPAATQTRYNAIYDSMSNINTNWRDEFLRNGSFSNHQVSVSGGAGKTRIFSSIGLYNEEGITFRTDMSRVTFRNNVDYADDKFSIALSSILGYTRRNFQQSTTTNNLGNPFLAANISVPYHVVRNPDGSYATGIGSKFAANNTLDATKFDENYNDQIKTTVGITSAYKITDALTAGFTAGLDFRESQNTNYGSRLAFNRVSSTSITGNAGFLSESLSRFMTGSIRPSLGFRKVLTERHDIDVNLSGEYIKEIGKGINFTGYGVDPKRPNTPAAIEQGNAVNQLYSTVGGSKTQNSLLSGLVTARYTFDGKYTVTGSYRRDGSSKLPENTRWQGFYSVGAIWEASKEAFIQDATWVNVLRVRGSYGGAGSANNFPGGDFPYLATYSTGSYSGINTVVATYPGNPDLKWETTFTANVGADFGFLKNRIYGDVNVYRRLTKDLFVSKRLSAVSGFGSINVNGGELENKGFEWNINIEPIRTRDFTWTLFTNGGYNKNEVLDLGGEPSYESGTSRITIGLPLGSHYEVKWGGVDAATGAPLYYTADGKLTNVYSASNAVQEFGTWESPWKGGFGSRISYNAFDASILFSWQKGATKVNNLEYFVENPNGFLGVGYNQANTLNFWQKPGDNAAVPSPSFGTNFSSKLIQDASFLRLREVSVAYSLPKNVLAKQNVVSNFRFFVQGNNLAIWTPWRGMDPEAGAANINLSEFPNPRAITVGIDVTF